MKKLLYILTAFVFVACSKDDTNSDISFKAVLGVEESISPFNGDELFYSDVAYGTGTRNQLDILLPKGGKPHGVVLFFHRGGFVSGSKEDIYADDLQETLQAILDQNISVVSANYTLLTTPGNQGVISALEDGAKVINYIQSQMSALNIPSNKIILAGASAGAGIAQWNGFREATNGQVQGVVALAAQSTYDLYEWENVFPGFYLDELRQMSVALQILFTQFYGGSEPTQAALDAIDYRDFMDANDPPVYLYNTAGTEVINAEGGLDFDVLYHSILHTDYLRLKAIEVGQEFSGAHQESPDAFVIRVLN
ncbi:alpha/beta hydrolase fold domain-containing protein [Flavobacteriaceae bacterium]|nr:alpha/beta hydrolase fold domain-containing protein [Flavobacteriaceae bacterium]